MIESLVWFYEYITILSKFDRHVTEYLGALFVFPTIATNETLCGFLGNLVSYIGRKGSQIDLHFIYVAEDRC